MASDPGAGGIRSQSSCHRRGPGPGQMAKQHLTHSFIT